MHARSTTVQVHPSSIDAQVAHVRDDVMPALLATDGPTAGIGIDAT